MKIRFSGKNINLHQDVAVFAWVSLCEKYQCMFCGFVLEFYVCA